MPDPNPNKKAKQQQSGKGKRANVRSGGAQPKKKPKRKEVRAQAHAARRNSEHERTDPGAECRWPRLGRPLRWLRRHDREILAICALLGIVVAVVVPIGVALLRPAPPESNRTYELVRMVPRVKRQGDETWGNVVQMEDQAQGGRVAVGMRVENPGFRPLTGLVGRASLPVALLPNGRCRYGINQPATTSCPGSPLVEGGVRLPTLQPQDWVLLVFEAEVPAGVPGHLYAIGLSISSDQAEEIKKTTSVEVPSTVAESTVRGLFAQTESETEFWHGEPEMAGRSKHFLIRRWPDMALERAHRFAQMPRGRVISLSDLFYDHTHEGRVVEVRGRIAGHPSAFQKDAHVVKQSYEVAVSGEDPKLRCYTWRPADHLLGEGDRLKIKLIPIAWTPNGSGEELTMGVCLSARVIRSDHHRGGA